MDQLISCEANYVPLTPISFLERAAAVYADRKSVIYGRAHFTWSQTYERARRLASALRSLGVAKNDVVSVLAPNVPALYEMHFAVPMAGAVLNAINTRLDAKNVATILNHAEAKIMFVDYEYVPLAKEAFKLMIADSVESFVRNPKIPLVVVIDDLDKPTGVRLGRLEYEEVVRRGNPRDCPVAVTNECDPIALNYTSGTTSAPKGVVYSHRGAYLSTLSLLLQWEVGSEPIYLWSLPMFHCNGWTFTWGMAARGGTNVCIRSPTAGEMYRAIADHGVTHMCGVPVLFTMLLNAHPSERQPISRTVQMLTGGAPPPAALLEKIERLGFHITHAYGMTEATGPALVCEWQSEWNKLPMDKQAQLKARQGVSVLTLSGADVKDPDTLKSVPRDGKTMGEIMLKGSSLMKGYFKNPAATSATFAGGWMRTGDVGVVHPDGYVEIKDRSKDVIISGGENISSVEVEAVLYGHPAVSEAAVVAMPHPHWGETPCAFVVVSKDRQGEVKEEEIIRYCRENMPRYMAPRRVVLKEELPKTSTGKVQKYELREWAKRLPCPATTSTIPAAQKKGRSGTNQRSSEVVHDDQLQMVMARSRL